jgi:hypothetical protein
VWAKSQWSAPATSKLGEIGVPPAESALTNIAKDINRKRPTMKQPVIDTMAFSGEMEFG